MSWQSDIEDIIGSVGDTGLITSSLRYIGSEVLNNLPDSRLKEVAQEKDITSGGLSIQSRRILAVHVNNYNAREGSVTNVAKYKDTGSIYASTAKTPVYYIKAEKVYVIADASSGETNGKCIYVPSVPTSDGDNSPLVYDDNVLPNGFPHDASNLITVGSAARCLQRLMSDKVADLPEEISDIVLPVTPVAPSLSGSSVTFNTSVPTYVPPSTSLSFSIEETFISTDEDVELASVKLQEINAQIAEYQADISNQLNLFNKANTEYQAELQKSIENARLSSKDDALILQKYGAEVQDYQSEVGSLVQKYSGDIQNFSSKIQKHMTEYSWKQSQYQQLRAEYIQGLQLLNGSASTKTSQSKRV